jgi:hypothetical protein
VKEVEGKKWEIGKVWFSHSDKIFHIQSRVAGFFLAQRTKIRKYIPYDQKYT